jgi:glutathione S-transferase
LSVPFQLIIGNKNYSSWSLRPWLAMKVAGIAFDEVLISLDAPDFKAQVTARSGAGKVPVLIDGDIHVWESLAILEYLAERFPGLWPTQAGARAYARAIAAEMHAGFLPLRRQLPMNIRRPVKEHALDDEAASNVSRIDAMWNECRMKFAGDGPFLYGAFCAADGMYAPVVWRFHTYAVKVSAPARAYMDAIMALPASLQWHGVSRGFFRTTRSIGRMCRGSRFPQVKRCSSSCNKGR